MKTSRYPRSAVASLWVGLVLSLGAVLIVFVDRATTDALAGHIGSGYPSYGAQQIEEAANLYLVLLVSIGALGALGWLVTIRGASRSRRWARWLSTALLLVGSAIALTMLTIRDTSGETGLAPLHGWIGMLPSLAGLIAVVLMWRGARRDLEGG